ncbi:MAG: hypothetical protein WDN31_09475 [Hyphomicrobium sp.]
MRGTIFDVYVISPTETWLLLIEGAVEVCPKNGKCLLHNQPGKLIRITADGVDAPSRWAKFKRRDDAAFNDAFPFIVEPPTIDPDPIFTRDDIVLSDEPVKPKKVEYEEEEQPKAKTYPSTPTTMTTALRVPQRSGRARSRSPTIPSRRAGTTSPAGTRAKTTIARTFPTCRIVLTGRTGHTTRTAAMDRAPDTSSRRASRQESAV